jgi:hypothetical protein
VSRLLSRAVDHLIVYLASFGMTADRSRQAVADVLAAGAPGDARTS